MHWADAPRDWRRGGWSDAVAEPVDGDPQVTGARFVSLCRLPICELIQCIADVTAAPRTPAEYPSHNCLSVVREIAEINLHANWWSSIIHSQLGWENHKAIFCVLVCYCNLFFKGNRKSLSEPGVSCSTSMSLVCCIYGFWINITMKRARITRPITLICSSVDGCFDQ